VHGAQQHIWPGRHARQGRVRRRVCTARQWLSVYVSTRAVGSMRTQEYPWSWVYGVSDVTGSCCAGDRRFREVGRKSVGTSYNASRKEGRLCLYTTNHGGSRSNCWASKQPRLPVQKNRNTTKGKSAVPLGPSKKQNESAKTKKRTYAEITRRGAVKEMRCYMMPGNCQLVASESGGVLDRGDVRILDVGNRDCGCSNSDQSHTVHCVRASPRV
jgi:hypothetical protein